MSILNLVNVTLNRGGRTLFTDLNWSLPAGRCYGLVGPDGSGKSSLVRAIARIDSLDGGRIERSRNLRIGYVAQDVDLPEDQTLLEVASVLPPELGELEIELERIEARLADPAVTGDEALLTRVLEHQERALERFETLGGLSHAGRVRSVLRDLGFSESEFEARIDSFSGGQKKLAALARVALDGPDVLLLDEPDNHLDLLSKEYLERFVSGFPGTVVLISHDRYLLDSLADGIAELTDGALSLYKGNYSVYSAERELRRARQAREFALQQKEIARLEAQIQRFELWASIVVNERHIKQARSRRKKIARMDELERPRDSPLMGLALEGGRGSRMAIRTHGLSMGFPQKLLFVDLELSLEHGERVGLVGANGSGKSVLLKLITGQLSPLEGRIAIGPSSRLGYYAQEHETLDRWSSRSALELVRDSSPVTEDEAVGFLMRFAFRYDQIRQPIDRMSGGERSRLQLARLMLQKPNVLLLDEPTNHLDLPSAEVLEAVLDDFNGALLVVSHDRYFLDRCVDRVIEIRDGELLPFDGGYTDYRAALSESGGD
ncbi:MAG: ABC-F family ATP-binding cassette domain-containing protein [bacterium]|nr:ABC-F family ATP-binding cassette domain-containing protein [bacterium]